MAQDYDKIIKENLNQAVPALIQSLLGLETGKTEPIELKLQHTLEREPDFLRKILPNTDDSNYILQAEFQSTPDDMRFRLMLYKSLLIQREKLPVKQVVFYIGNKKANLKTVYEDEDLFFRYYLIDFKTISYKQFLNSTYGEEVIFAVLADFEKEASEKVVEEIVKRLKEVAAGSLQLEKYARQLEVLSKLRNLQELTINTLKRMPIVYDLKTDVRFLQGMKEGAKTGEKIGMELLSIIVAIELIKLETFPVNQIAQIAKSPLKVIKEIQTNLKKEIAILDLLQKETSIEQISKEMNVSLNFVKAIKMISEES